MTAIVEMFSNKYNYHKLIYTSTYEIWASLTLQSWRKIAEKFEHIWSPETSVQYSTLSRHHQMNLLKESWYFIKLLIK